MSNNIENNIFNSPVDILFELVKNRKKIIWITFFISLLVAVYSLMMPKTYASRSVVVPVEDGTGLGFSGLGDLSSLSNLTSMGSSPEIIKLKSILDSRSLRTKIINHFHLMDKYQVDYIEDALVRLDDKVSTEISPEGNLIISFNDETNWFSNKLEERETSEFVANVTNEFIHIMDNMNKQLNTDKARNNRVFLENRLKENIHDMKCLEDSIKSFSNKFGIFNIEAQTAAAIHSAAELKSQIIETEIMLNISKKNFNDDNLQITELENRLCALNEQSLVFESNEFRDNSALSNIFPKFSESPDITVDFLVLQRELEVQGLIYQFITQQYEQAKLQELKDTPTIQVLDRAIPKNLRSKPKRTMLVLVSAVITILLTSLYIILNRKLKVVQAEDPERFNKINYIVNGLNIFKKLPE